MAYFSWGGNTQKVAGHIVSLTGGTLFRIEPEKPYPTEYTPCTEVAKAEKEALEAEMQEAKAEKESLKAEMEAERKRAEEAEKELIRLRAELEKLRK